MAFGEEPFEVDAAPAGRGRAARAAVGAGVGAVSAGSIAAVTLAFQAVLEAYLPVWLTRLDPGQVPIVAAGVVTGAGLVVGGVWGLVAPAVRRALGVAVLLAGVVLILTGCIARFGPVVLGIGQVESCSGAYSYSDARGWRCEGEYVAGAAISEQGSRVVGGVADAARSTALQVIGVPPPPKATGP